MLQSPSVTHSAGNSVSKSHSRSLAQGKSALISSATFKHTFNWQGPPSPHAASAVQTSGTPARRIGKYCKPTPIPADSGARKKVTSASPTSVHLSESNVVSLSIEPELSSIR